MSAFIGPTLTASAALMLLVLLVRAPVRRLVGPRLAYALWLLPALRMVLPSLPALPVAGPASRMTVLFSGPQGVLTTAGNTSSIGEIVLIIWLTGALALFATYAIRHIRFCRRLRASGTDFGRSGPIRIIVADVEGPLAFGVLRRFIAVPHAFAHDYTAPERELALAHETAHHKRGDLIANWISLVVLAAHWWNPVAWLAIRAFRDDQEFAADAHVLAGSGPGATAQYAQVLAKAAGLGALPACNLNARSNLKGRLMTLAQKPRSARRIMFGGAALILAGGTALAATVPASGTGKQAVTLVVKPDGSGGYALIVGNTAVAPGARLPGGMTLPGDFKAPGGCDLKPMAKPHAMVIKGTAPTQTYTVMCASAAPAPVSATLTEGLTSLRTMRASVATQPASAAFPEPERAHALAAIDRSIAEVKAAL